MALLQLPLPECAKMAASVNNFRFTALQWLWRRRRGRAIKSEARERGRKRKKHPSFPCSHFNMQRCFLFVVAVVCFPSPMSVICIHYSETAQFLFFFFWLCSAIQTCFSRRKKQFVPLFLRLDLTGYKHFAGELHIHSAVGHTWSHIRLRPHRCNPTTPMADLWPLRWAL